ncbi:MAG: hypothetical protein AAF485_06870 [Chloroflexota bacterium]
MIDFQGLTGAFAAKTSDDGCATIVVPGALPDEYWPVIGRMDSLSEYNLITPEEVSMDQNGPHQVDFLYTD